jgi:hypothetical protein
VKPYSLKICLDWILLFLMLGYTALGFTQYTPKAYTALHTVEELQIDGIANEAAWETSLWTSNFVDIEGFKQPKYNTKIKMTWSDKYFYVFAKMQEPHVWGNLKQRDTVIFYNNDFEIFIDPDGDTHNYYELEINALNTVWDLFLTKPYRNGTKVLDSWDIQGLKSAVKINGTINNATDTDVGWTLEIAIPWKVIVEASNSSDVPVNEFWRINFSRVNWDFDLIEGKYHRKKKGDKFLPEYNWVWSPQNVINMHEPERWGYVFFSKQSNRETFQFKIPKEEKIKWKLYEFYRQLHKNVNSELPKAIQIEGESITLHFKKHDFGWNLWVLSPYNKTKLIIREDGKFFSL